MAKDKGHHGASPLVAGTLGGLAYGILTAMAFPPVGLWPAAFLAPAPLVWAAAVSGKKPRWAGIGALLGTLPLWLFEERWVIAISPVGFALMALGMAVWPAAFVWIMARLRAGGRAAAMWWSAPLVWVMLEVGRGEIAATGYPWFLAGHPLIEQPQLAAAGGVVGAYGVSALLVGIAAAFIDAGGWTAARRSAGGLGAGVIAVAWCVLSVLGWRIGPEAAAPSDTGTESPKLRIAAVQTAVPQSLKLDWTVDQRLADMARFAELSRLAMAERQRPDLVVWPETMFPGIALNAEALDAEVEAGLYWSADRGSGPERIATTFFRDELVRLQTELGAPMVVGAGASEGVEFIAEDDGTITRETKARYNSVFVVHGGRVLPVRYDKVALTPFGEFIPYLGMWPALRDRVVSVGAAGVVTLNLASGSSLRSLEVPAPAAWTQSGRQGDGTGVIRLATPVCFEVTKPSVCRTLVYSGADNGDGAGGVVGSEGRAALIVNLSNDGWFGDTLGTREQSLQCARWRCVELGVPLVRAVNTGISAHADRHGRLITSGVNLRPAGERAGAEPGAARTGPSGADGVLVSDVQISTGPGATAYASWGFTVTWGLMLAGLGVTVIALLPARVRRGGR